MKTYQPKSKDIKRDWHLIDAKDQILGRLSTKIATLLIGKHKPGYSANIDSGDIVVVINAKDIKVTGNKERNKKYITHSGYPGGKKELKFFQVMEKDPRKIIEKAVKGMLPVNRLTKARIVRLKVFAENVHPYGKIFDQKK